MSAGVQCEAGEGRVGARNEEATPGLACVADSLNYRFRTKPVVFERLRPAAPQANPGSTVKNGYLWALLFQLKEIKRLQTLYLRSASSDFKDTELPPFQSIALVTLVMLSLYSNRFEYLINRAITAETSVVQLFS